jgi:RHS repeat-associated protein
MYGSARRGMAKPEREVTGFFWASAAYTLVAGAKSYELSNHLGNVMAVISDRGELQSAQDYFPFGMAMPGRSTDAKHRYGFNGKETDPETGLNDFGARLYDSRLGRWLAVDPLEKKYPDHSSYSYAGNNPILYVDYDGMDWGVKVTKGKDGAINVHFTLKAAVMNSSTTAVDMAKFRTAVEQQLNKSYSGTFKTTDKRKVKVSMCADIRIIKTKKDLAKDDHLIEIKDMSFIGAHSSSPNNYAYASDLNGNSKIGGKGVMVNANYAHGIESRADNNTIPHEIGHTGGLYHPDVSEGMEPLKRKEGQLFSPHKGQDKHNIMYSNTPVGINVNDKTSTEVNQSQIHILIKKIQTKKVNLK